MTRSSSAWYKGVRVGKGCALASALERNDEKEAKKIHAEAMADFKHRYPQCTDEWFARMNAQ